MKENNKQAVWMEQDRTDSSQDLLREQQKRLAGEYLQAARDAFDQSDYAGMMENSKKAEQCGSPTGLTYQAAMYWYGYGVRQDREYALELYRMAAQEDEPEAQLQYAKNNPDRLEAKDPECWQYLRAAARAGIPEAQGLLGFYLWIVEDSPEAWSEAFDWVSQAFANGDPNGKVWMALFYIFGVGTKENEAYGKSLLLSEAASKNAGAREILETLFSEEEITEIFKRRKDRFEIC